ncbi:MAG: PcfJ domain-containing protein [Halobacteriota archaeon]
METLFLMEELMSTGIFGEFNEASHTPIDTCVEQSRIDSLAKTFPDGMRIVWDEENSVIRVGKLEAKNFSHYKSLGAFVGKVLEENGVHASYHPKWRMKAASVVFGRGPRAFFTHFNKLQYKHFVAPYLHLLNPVAYKPGRVSLNALRLIKRNLPVVQEVYDDGLHNILPIVVATGKSPQELKKLCGPSWKLLTQNTLGRNRVLVDSIGVLNFTYSVGLRTLSDRAKLPTTVVKKFGAYADEALEHIAAHYRGKWSSLKAKDVSDIAVLVRDTKRLAEYLALPFNTSWSPRKMKEKHDEYTKKFQVKEFSDNKISWIMDGDVVVKEMCFDGFKATVLDNKATIAEEGRAMGHCVGSYAESVAKKSYLVYSITDSEGVRSSTLGIRVSVMVDQQITHSTIGGEDKAITIEGGTSFVFSQHYGKFNAPVKNESELLLGRMIIEKLNQINKQDRSEAVWKTNMMM